MKVAFAHLWCFSQHVMREGKWRTFEGLQLMLPGGLRVIFFLSRELVTILCMTGPRALGSLLCATSAKDPLQPQLGHLTDGELDSLTGAAEAERRKHLS